MRKKFKVDDQQPKAGLETRCPLPRPPAAQRGLPYLRTESDFGIRQTVVFELGDDPLNVDEHQNGFGGNPSNALS